MFLVPCYDICYDYRIKRCSVHYHQLFVGGLVCCSVHFHQLFVGGLVCCSVHYHQLFVGGLVCYLCYLYLYSSSRYSSVQYDLFICVTWRVSY